MVVIASYSCLLYNLDRKKRIKKTQNINNGPKIVNVQLEHITPLICFYQTKPLPFLALARILS